MRVFKSTKAILLTFLMATLPRATLSKYRLMIVREDGSAFHCAGHGSHFQLKHCEITTSSKEMRGERFSALVLYTVHIFSSYTSEADGILYMKLYLPDFTTFFKHAYALHTFRFKLCRQIAQDRPEELDASAELLVSIRQHR